MAAEKSAIARSSSRLATQPLARLKCAMPRFSALVAADPMIAVQAAMPSSGAVSLFAQRCHSVSAAAGHGIASATIKSAPRHAGPRLVALAQPPESIDRLGVGRIERDRALEI